MAASFFFRFKIKALAPILNWGGQKEKDMVTRIIEISLKQLTLLLGGKRRQRAASSEKEQEV
jgi:hypothetical protein